MSPATSYFVELRDRPTVTLYNAVYWYSRSCQCHHRDAFYGHKISDGMRANELAAPCCSTQVLMINLDA